MSIESWPKPAQNPSENESLNKTEKLIRLKIDNSTALGIEQEESTKRLFEILPQITAKELNDAEEEINKFRNFENLKDDMLDKLDAGSVVISSIRQMQQFQDKQGVLEKLAKRNLNDLDLLSQGGLSVFSDKLGSAISLINKACRAISELKFPEDLEKQLKARYKKDEEWVEEARKNAAKMNIS